MVATAADAFAEACVAIETMRVARDELAHFTSPPRPPRRRAEGWLTAAEYRRVTGEWDVPTVTRITQLWGSWNFAVEVLIGYRANVWVQWSQLTAERSTPLPETAKGCVDRFLVAFASQDLEADRPVGLAAGDYDLWRVSATGGTMRRKLLSSAKVIEQFNVSWDEILVQAGADPAAARPARTQASPADSFRLFVESAPALYSRPAYLAWARRYNDDERRTSSVYARAERISEVLDKTWTELLADAGVPPLNHIGRPITPNTVHTPQFKRGLRTTHVPRTAAEADLDDQAARNATVLTDTDLFQSGQFAPLISRQPARISLHVRDPARVEALYGIVPVLHTAHAEYYVAADVTAAIAHDLDSDEAFVLPNRVRYEINHFALTAPKSRSFSAQRTPTSAGARQKPNGTRSRSPSR